MLGREGLPGFVASSALVFVMPQLEDGGDARPVQREPQLGYLPTICSFFTTVPAPALRLSPITKNSCSRRDVGPRGAKASPLSIVRQTRSTA